MTYGDIDTGQSSLNCFPLRNRSLPEPMLTSQWVSMVSPKDNLTENAHAMSSGVTWSAELCVVGICLLCPGGRQREYKVFSKGTFYFMVVIAPTYVLRKYPKHPRPLWTYKTGPWATICVLLYRKIQPGYNTVKDYASHMYVEIYA